MVIVYHAPSLNNPLLMAFLLVNELPTQHRILIVGNFNLDQMLLKNVAKIASLIQNCNLSQCLTIFNSYAWGNIRSCIWFFQFQYCFFLSSPYSDHFVRSFQIGGKDVICIALLEIPALYSLFCNYGPLKFLLKRKLNEK